MANQNNKYLDNCLNKLNKKNAVIGIIGLGYVGLPLSLAFTQKKFNVIGFDIKEEIIQKISNCESYIHHINDSDIRQSVKDGLLKATSDFSKIADVDFIIICVPTPLNEYREPDISFITSTVNSSLPYLKKGHLISLESTTYPGTTE